MQLTLHTDFSLRTLIYVALKREGELSTVSEVAEALSISRNHLVKVVHHLGQAGFLQTVQGKNGGMMLAKPAALIGVGDVIREMEPTLQPVDCNKPSGRCRLLPSCELRHALQEASAAFMAVLDRYTLADLVAEPASLVKLVGINITELPRAH
ncbi:MAG: Rrf2 family transcriptional regulator [Pedobacter sp.]|nr:Rrf2 family transcriptional regulator [Pedobacter sp.]